MFRSTRIAVMLVLAVAGLGLGGVMAGCNTIEGAGEDVSAAGEGISNAAEKTGEAISGDKHQEY